MVGAVGAMVAATVGATAGYLIENSESYAEVLAVSPITITVFVSPEECRDQFGVAHRPTRDIGQVAGSVTGGYAGKESGLGVQHLNVRQANQRDCDAMLDRRQVQVGYGVTYRLNGQERTIRMNDNPGGRIRIENGKPVIR